MPNNKVKLLLQSLRSVSDQINRESDELLKALKSIEYSLGVLNLGIAVWLKTPIYKESDPQHGGTDSTRLGYDKADDKNWGLYLAHDFNEETQGFKRLIDAKREEKVVAMEHLEQLIEEMLRQAEKKAQRIRSAKSTAEQVVEELGEEPPF